MFSSYGDPVGILVNGVLIFSDHSKVVNGTRSRELSLYHLRVYLTLCAQNTHTQTGTQHIEPFVHKADSCNGHSDKGHRYHYHALPKCLLENLGVPAPSNGSYYYKNWHTLSVDEQIDLWPETGTPSPLIGYVTITLENITLS